MAALTCFFYTCKSLHLRVIGKNQDLDISVIISINGSPDWAGPRLTIMANVYWALTKYYLLTYIVSFNPDCGPWQPTLGLLPGKSHGRRSLVGCSPWGRKESDTTERLHFHFSLSSIGEGNGTLLQYSCLENPRDRGAWWAAIYGVTKSRTRLKQLNLAVPLEGQSCD